MMRKSLLFTVIIMAVMTVAGCQQYVPTPGQADMVQYTFVGPEDTNGK